uniref:Immunoglobulin V-set domain-containing protein n=1 Tax=Pundamilia nyererei TaxID=303518 RepID=A0A3B4H4X8_9CICH
HSEPPAVKHDLFTLYFVFLVSLRCLTSAVGMIHVTGYVNVSCSYDEGYESYEKYLCKNDCGDSDLLITTSNSSKNKYSIHDNKTSRIFTTTISDLHSVDAGKYWCGVTRTGKDIYTEVELKLTDIQPKARAGNTKNDKEGEQHGGTQSDSGKQHRWTRNKHKRTHTINTRGETRKLHKGGRHS